MATSISINATQGQFVRHEDHLAISKYNNALKIIATQCHMPAAAVITWLMLVSARDS